MFKTIAKCVKGEVKTVDRNDGWLAELRQVGHGEFEAFLGYIHSEFWNNLNYRVNPCFKKREKTYDNLSLQKRRITRN